MLQSVSDFNTYVDTRSGSRADKNDIKSEGATLARAAVREAVAHANKHLNAALLDNPGETELAARISMMQESTSRSSLQIKAFLSWPTASATLAWRSGSSS